MCPSAASPPTGSSGTGTLLSSTCSQPLEKPQVSPRYGWDEEGRRSPPEAPLSPASSATGRSPQRPQKMDGELSRLFPQSLGQPRAPLPATSSLPSPLQVGEGLARGAWESLDTGRKGKQHSPHACSPAGPALPARSSTPPAALAARCAAPRSRLPFPQAPRHHWRRYQRLRGRGEGGQGQQNDVSFPHPQVTRREDGPVPPGPRSLDPLLKLSGDLC